MNDTKTTATEENHNKVSISIEVQYATMCSDTPDKNKIINWAKHAITQNKNNRELTIRIVDEEEIQELNKRWRGIDESTNVLSFPAGDNEIAPDYLGDIAICAPVIISEAKAQDKKPDAHWAHMVIHGVLHLLGYDHTEDEDANIMESHEINILRTLSFSNPYE